MKNILFTVLILLSIQNQAQTYYSESITGSRPYLGQTNQAILEIKFADNNSSLQIQKPLIVVEGFDSGLLGIENEYGEVDLDKFIRSSSRQISNLPSQINTYDIIYINFKNGKDFMQRNAYLVQDIIKWVNSVKQGSLPNVVLGQSMGGVIARYALRDMENQLASTGNQTWQHKTSLYISHDAPHQGANMPLSIQYFARHLADQFVSTPLGDMNINVSGNGGAVSIEDMQDLLEAPGTKQLLANYINSGFSLNNSVGDSFRTELRNLGYPQQTRNISLSNGNHCANPQNFNPNDNLFTFNGSGQTKLLTDLIFFLNPLMINLITYISLAVLFNEPGLLVGILPGNSKFELSFWGNALPNAGANNQIYHGNIRFTKTLFRLFGWAPKITVTLTNRNYSAPGILSYDYYPGGKYQSFITGGNSSVSNIFGSFGIQMSARDNFNFIPTPSALDIGNGSVALNNNDYFMKYNKLNPPVGSKNSPFINFSTSHNTSGINENHISFNTRNGNWLALELDNVANNEDNFSCIKFCSDAQITGNDILCSSATYSVTNETTTVIWSVSDPNGLVNYSINGNNITLNQNNSNNYGFVTLTVFYSNPKCGSITVTKNIEVGIHPYRFSNSSITGEDYICGFQSYTYTLNNINHPCVSTVNWSVSPNLSIISQTQNSVTVAKSSLDNQYAGVISANIPNSSVQIRKGVWVGVPNSNDLSIQKLGAYDFYVGTWTKLMASYTSLIYPENGAYNLTYEWQIPYSMVRNYTDTAFKDVKPNIGGELNIGVRACNPCGCSNWKYQLFTVGGSAGPNELTPLKP
jgi:hypothetical protein